VRVEGREQINELGSAAKLLLEILNGTRQGWLGNIAALGRARALAHGQKVANCMDLHGAPIELPAVGRMSGCLHAHRRRPPTAIRHTRWL
jgi:hypothetical protein